MIDRTSLRLSATLMLVGQLLYIVVTLFHADGEANNHPAVFAEYAGSRIWTAVHLGQFACMAILLAGLLALFFALDVQAGTARWQVLDAENVTFLLERTDGKLVRRRKEHLLGRVAVHQAAELRDPSAFVDPQIVEDEDLLVVERQLVFARTTSAP